MRRTYLFGVLYTILGAAGFSAKAILAKLCYRYGIDGFSTLTLRMIFALPLYVIIFSYAYRKISVEQKISLKNDFLKIGLIGLFGYYFASWFDFVGLEYISASFERLLLFVYPTLVVIISIVWLRSKVTLRQIAALAVTYIGIAFAFWHEKSISGSNVVTGSVYVLLAALVYAVYLTATEKMTRRYSPLIFTSLALIISIGAVILHAVVIQAHLYPQPAMVYILTLVMAVFCTVLPSLFVSKGIQLIGSSTASIIGTLGPVMTIYLAYLMLDEIISGEQIAGTALVLLGILILTLQPARQSADLP